MIIKKIYDAIWFKRGAEPCCSFHDVKAFALPCLSKRATSKAPRRCMYISYPYPLHPRRDAMRAVYNTPREAFTVALFLTNSLEVAKFLHRQNQSVKVNAFYVYVCPTQPFLPIKQYRREGTLQIYGFICISLQFCAGKSCKLTNVL